MMIEKLADVWTFQKTGVGEMRVPFDKMLVNDVTWPWEYNPHGVHPWIIYGEFGPLGLLWASHLQDALDISADEGLLDAYMVPEEERVSFKYEELARLGNAGEPFDLTYVGYLELDAGDFPKQLVAEFAAAAEAGYDTLERLG